MKTKSKIEIVALSILSSIVLALFLIVSLGSEGLLWETTTVTTHEVLEDGRRETTYTTGHEDKNKTIKKIHKEI